jgi:hypothetical protein
LVTAAGTLAVLLGAATAAQALVTVTADPETGMNSANATLFTADPYVEPVTGFAARGLAADRRLRQTFKNPTTFNVGEIIISFDVTSAPETGMALRFYQVADVTAGTWTAGELIKQIVVTDPLPGSNMYLSFELTGSDVFELPARGTAGDTLGYGIEISTAFSNTSDGNTGLFNRVNAPETDLYLDGRAYREGGQSESLFRDHGVSLLASLEEPCEPGDVNCMDGVTLDDLAILAAHFRQTGGHDDGDLTGNGFIDFDDFDQWKQNYFGPPPGAGALSFLTVPEPASAALLVLGAAGLVPIGLRRRAANAAA